MLSGNKYTAYAPWALQMLLRWAKEDPVSQKEIDRNNAVYGIQHNRNPFIDFPGLEQYVWGSQTNTAFDPDNYENTGGGTEPEPPVTEVAAPTFTPAQGTIERGTEVTISTFALLRRMRYSTLVRSFLKVSTKAKPVVGSVITTLFFFLLRADLSDLFFRSW